MALVDVFPFSFLLHDWRMSVPDPRLDDSRSLTSGKHASMVPVIRLFGYSSSSEISSAKQCCVNIHQYYPKIMLEYLGHDNLDLLGLSLFIDEKLSGVVVRNISPVAGKFNFYGYHSTAIANLICIELFRPIDVSRIAELLTPHFRPYEVHIPYVLQLLIEYGIQGVSPLYIDPSQISITSPRTTFCEIEISIRTSAILPKPKPIQDSTCPFPPPLSSAPGNDELVCEVLRSLWEEEFERTRPFPYRPEGMVDGLHRPDCSEMPHVLKRREKLENFLSHLEGRGISGTAVSSTPPSTQGLLNDLLGNDSSFPMNLHQSQYDLSMGDEDTREIAPTFLQVSPTVVVSEAKPLPPAPSLPEVIEPTKRAVVPPTNPPIRPLLPNKACLLRYTIPPPSVKAEEFVSSQQSSSHRRLTLTANTAPIEGPLRTVKPLDQLTPTVHDTLTFCTMAVIELIVDTTTTFPDPKTDPVLAISMLVVDERLSDSPQRLYLFLNTLVIPDMSVPDCEVHQFGSEILLLENFCIFFLNSIDPSVVISWDSSRLGLGFLSERSRVVNPGFNSFSRVIGAGVNPHDPTRISGRLVLDLWRVMRNDVETGLKLGTTSLCGVVQAVLGQTAPNIPLSTLSSWFKIEKKIAISANRIVRNTLLVFEIADTVRVMATATEMSRLYGMDLESVFTRGSQFRVECMLVRATRKLGFVLPSSSKTQVKNQSATEGIPMVLEPASGLITEPVCVFDFQSLYPSIMIGYNICYSTCLGRAHGEANIKLGTQENFLRSVSDIRKAIIVPGDCMFVQRSERLGIIPRIVHEIIQTRFMVKKSMKTGSKSPALLRQLEARQLSLKLLANVVYGYTTASFSGRMPCAEIADSIVLTARESLESVMRTAESMGGTIVYGDTDSLFVKLPSGTSVEDAFLFGTKLVDQVAIDNPWPMKLVHEKVYYPCCLVTKKRYVGRAYETPNQFRLDAKGIETIRRDTCPAVAVTIERILNSVFDMVTTLSYDPSTALEIACITEFSNFLKPKKIPQKFFVFQNQVRQVGSYKDMNHLPPAARVAVDQGRTDLARGERIAYVVTQGAAKSKLSDQVMPPNTLLEGGQKISLEYYTTKQIVPAVQRIFGPIANRAYSWLSVAREMVGEKNIVREKNKLSVTNRHCVVCNAIVASSIFSSSSNIPLLCAKCLQPNAQPRSIAHVASELRKAEHRVSETTKICFNCTSGAPIEGCQDAYHCSNYFERFEARKALAEQYANRQRMKREISLKIFS